MVAAAALAGCARDDAPSGREVAGAGPTVERVPVSRSVRPPAPTTGLDPALLARAEEVAEGLPRLNALVVARGGDVYLDRAFRGPPTSTPVNIKSASKSVLSALTGAAIADGVLEGTEQRVVDILGGVPEGADPRVADITVGHLLSMRAGLESTSGRNYGRWAVSSDPVAHALTRPVVDVPGGRMIYSTGTSHILSAVLTAASGTTTLELARRYLGEPLGIDVPPWPRDPNGIYYGGNDMLLSPRALLRLGQCFRLGGEWRGERVVPEGWVERSWERRGRSRWTGDGYGYGWWLRRMGGHDVAYAWGYGGQMLYVVPSLELVVAMTSPSAPSDARRGHVAGLHTLMRDVLVPAAERGGAAEAL